MFALGIIALVLETTAGFQHTLSSIITPELAIISAVWATITRLMVRLYDALMSFA